MKIFISDLAEKLHDKGFTWKDIDNPEIDNFIIEYLSSEGLFDKLYDEMVLIKEEKGDS